MIYFQDKNITIYNVDVMDGLGQIEAESIQCVVTSPPYWGLRDYGVDGQIGLEKTPEEYIEKMVQVFRGVHRVLKKDGTLWINIGDSYANPPKKGGGDPTIGRRNLGVGSYPDIAKPENLKPKDLVGIPWMLAFALRSDGWYLRQDIIWSKPNPMPESVRDRCTKSHEYIFMLSKSKNYFYDAAAIRTPWESGRDDMRGKGIRTGLNYLQQQNMPKNHKEGRADKQRGHGRRHAGFNERWDQMPKEEQQANGANKRSVWNVATQGYPDAHFATFPPALIEPCILAGSAPGDVVLDLFWGSGTTGHVARQHQRKAIGIELNADYCELSLKRFKQGVLFYNVHK